MNLKLCCPTLFGLEGLVGDELRYQGKLEKVQVENGRVLFWGDERTLVWANLWLRCGERVLIEVGSFAALTFDQLFEGIKALPWEQFIPADGRFPVKGYSLNSKLHSVPDCQKIIKKATADRLQSVYHTSLEETGAKYQIQFSIMKDRVTVYLDTSGAGLHKRGYRANANAAPLRETLAAAMVKLARFKGREALYDPFCGSGTIAIEAAWAAQNRAPGLLRHFSAEEWPWIPQKLWQEEREKATAQIWAGELSIFGSDIDPACVELSQENAAKAQVANSIHFTCQDACRLDFSSLQGTMICNPPYGERLGDIEEAQDLYRRLGKACAKSHFKKYILTSDEEFEYFFGKKADKRRKLYNGMIKCNLYMYFKDQPFRKR